MWCCYCLLVSWLKSNKLILREKKKKTLKEPTLEEDKVTSKVREKAE